MTSPKTSIEVNVPITVTSFAGIVAGISLQPEKVKPSFVGSSSGVITMPQATFGGGSLGGNYWVFLPLIS